MREWWLRATFRVFGRLWFGGLADHCFGLCSNPWAHVNRYKQPARPTEGQR
jgi:hypothetical protein